MQLSHRTRPQHLAGASNPGIHTGCEDIPAADDSATQGGATEHIGRARSGRLGSHRLNYRASNDSANVCILTARLREQTP